jgi:hypothetical protein
MTNLHANMEQQDEAQSVVSGMLKRSSVLSNASAKLRFEEAQKMQALQQKQGLATKKLELEKEMAKKKRELKQTEEKFELQRQLAITEARSKAIDEYDQDDGSKAVAAVLNESLENKIQTSATFSELQPDAAEFIPKEADLFAKPSEIVDNHVGSTVSYIDNNNNFNQDVITTVVQQLKRPKQDIKKFGGDTAEYKRFTRQFESCVVANTLSEERMAYLDQFITDEAHKIVVSYAAMHIWMLSIVILLPYMN